MISTMLGCLSVRPTRPSRMNASILRLVLAPAAAEDLDGDDAARARVVGAVDPAEAPRRDLVEDAVAAQEVAVGVALEELRGLEVGQVALAFEDAHEVDQVGRDLAVLVAHLVDRLVELGLVDQPDPDRQLAEHHRVRDIHDRFARAGQGGRGSFHVFYPIDSRIASRRPSGSGRRGRRRAAPGRRRSARRRSGRPA